MKSPLDSERLTSREIFLAWVAVLFFITLGFLSYGFGSYALARGGAYDIGSAQVQSFDPKTYFWFFQSSFGFYIMLSMGSLFGLILEVYYALLPAVIAIVILTVFKPLAPVTRRVLYYTKYFILPVFIIAFLAGMGETIRRGLNPGVCC